MKKIILLILLTLYCSPVHAGTYGESVVNQAQKYDYVREKTNHNDGPEIERWLRNVGLTKGNPYCQSFAYSMFLEVQPELKGTMPLKTGRVSYNWEYAKRNPYKFKIITPNQIALGIHKLEPGDIVVWATGDKNVRDFSGHTGFVLYQIDKESFRTIEANTMPTNEGDQREGGGIYYRTRVFKYYWNFRLQGFIRPL